MKKFHEEYPVEVAKLYLVEYPKPEEKAVLTLARVLNDTGPKQAAVPYELQEQAAKFYNEHGLSKTLDKIIRLGGVEALE